MVYLRKNPLQRKYLFAKKFFPFDVIPQAFYSFPCNPLFVSRLVLKSIWLSRKQSWKCSLFVIISGLVVISKREMDGGRYTQKQGMDCGFPVDVYVYLPHKCKHIMQDYWDSCVVTGYYYTTSGRNWNGTTIVTSIQICKIPRGISYLLSKLTVAKVKILAPHSICTNTYQNGIQWLLLIGP